MRLALLAQLLFTSLACCHRPPARRSDTIITAFRYWCRAVRDPGPGGCRSRWRFTAVTCPSAPLREERAGFFLVNIDNPFTWDLAVTGIVVLRSPVLIANDCSAWLEWMLFPITGALAFAAFCWSTPEPGRSDLARWRCALRFKVPGLALVLTPASSASAGCVTGDVSQQPLQ